MCIVLLCIIHVAGAAPTLKDRMVALRSRSIIRVSEMKCDMADFVDMDVSSWWDIGKFAPWVILSGKYKVHVSQ